MSKGCSCSNLCLHPPGGCPPSSTSDSVASTSVSRIDGSPPASTSSNHIRQPLTIFYGGRICVIDATEIQANAILCLAKRGMEERTRNHRDATASLTRPPTTAPTELLPPALRTGESTAAATQLPLPHHSNLSMKGSLQRFLQKRKTRMGATAPYQLHHQR